jgi:8-oxo-dGTP pyrophosphatase MutT (NUDIX family)
MVEPAYRRPEKVLVFLYRMPPGAPSAHPSQGHGKGQQEAIEYLLLQRHPERTESGDIWQAVVGNVRWEEARIEAVRREVSQETGLTLDGEVWATGYSFSYSLRLHADQESWYAPAVTAIRNIVYASQVVDHRSISLCPEHVDYGWFAYANALEKLYWAEEKQALSRLHPMIARQTRSGR